MTYVLGGETVAPGASFLSLVVSHHFHCTNQSLLLNQKSIEVFIPRTTKKTRSSFRRGVAVVEAGITLPIVVFLTMAVLDTCDGIFLHQKAIIAAQEGARVAVGESANPADIQQAVAAYLDARGISYDDIAASVAVSPSPNSAALLDPIAVTVSIDLATNRRMPIPLYQVFNGQSVSGTVTMLKEK